MHRFVARDIEEELYMRPDQEARDDITEDQGLLECL